MTRLAGIVVGLAVALAAGPAISHSEAPEAVIAALGAEEARAASGIDRVARDPHQPRLLFVRVGEGWWKLPAEVRRERAAAWAARWRHAVPQGIVAVLDARTDQPVVRFGRGGDVVGIAPTRP